MGWPPKAENYTIWIEVLDWLKLHYIIYSVSQQYLNDGVKNTYTRITFYIRIHLSCICKNFNLRRQMTIDK